MSRATWMLFLGIAIGAAIAIVACTAAKTSTPAVPAGIAWQAKDGKGLEIQVTDENQVFIVAARRRDGTAAELAASSPETEGPALYSQKKYSEIRIFRLAPIAVLDPQGLDIVSGEGDQCAGCILTPRAPPRPPELWEFKALSLRLSGSLEVRR